MKCKTAIFGLSSLVFLAGCSGEKASDDPPQFEYRVLTEASLDRLIYDAWFKQGIAEPVGNTGQIKILDVNRANSEVTMPAVFNAFGDQGWELAGISPSKLYIFVREKREGGGASNPAAPFTSTAKPTGPSPPAAPGTKPKAKAKAKAKAPEAPEAAPKASDEPKES